MNILSEHCLTSGGQSTTYSQQVTALSWNAKSVRRFPKRDELTWKSIA